MTGGFFCQEFSYEISHSNPERIAFMFANNCTKSMSGFHQLALKDDEMGFVTDRSVSWELHTERLASSSPPINRARECATYIGTLAYDKAYFQMTRTDRN